jgi:hypothetical protein
MYRIIVKSIGAPSKIVSQKTNLLERAAVLKCTEERGFCNLQDTIVNSKTRYSSPSPGERELEGGRFHLHLNPLPLRARNFIRDYAEYYSLRKESYHERCQ